MLGFNGSYSINQEFTLHYECKLVGRVLFKRLPGAQYASYIYFSRNGRVCHPDEQWLICIYRSTNIGIVDIVTL